MIFHLKKENVRHTPALMRFSVSVFFFVSGFNFATWTSRIPTLQKQLHMNDAELGTVLAALPAGLISTMPLAGILLTKTRSQYVMLVSAVIYTILLYILGTVSSIAEMGIILFLFGASRNFFNISINTQAIGVQSYFNKSIITTFHGIWSLAALSGAGTSFLFISASITLVNHFLIVSAFSMLLIFALFPFALPEDKKKTAIKPSFLWPDPSLIKLGFVGFVSMVCEGTMSDWSGVYFSKILHMSDSMVITGYVFYLTAMLTGRFLGDWIVHIVGVKSLLQISSILITSGFFFAILLPFIIPVCFGFVLIGLGVSCNIPLIMGITPKISNLPTGAAIATISIISYLGFLTGPPIVGFISHALNLKWAFLISALIAFSTYWIVKKLIV